MAASTARSASTPKPRASSSKATSSRSKRSGCSFAIVALLVAIPGSAGAQTKKKKPKKPKTEQRKPQEEPLPPPAEEPAPAPIDTNLRAEEPTTPSTNPWTASGIAKRRGDPPSDSDTSERKKTEASTAGSRPVAVAAQGGYASDFLRIGFGVRAGYSINDKIYLGGAFVYHLGTSIAGSTISFYYPAFEGGYDLHLDAVTIRPYGGVGPIWAHLSRDSLSSGVTSSAGFVFYPGVQVDYQVGSSAGFVGIDARVLLLLGGGDDFKNFGTPFGFFAVGGARF